MSIVDDVLKAFDRIPIWKRLQETPKEIDELRDRVSALESLLNGKRPGDACPFCGALAFRLFRVIGHGTIEQWRCSDCEKTRDVRLDLNRPSVPLPTKNPFL